jgi:hypothetical protein
MRALQVLSPVAGKISISEVVSYDHDDIWFCGRPGAYAEKYEK